MPSLASLFLLALLVASPLAAADLEGSLERMIGETPTTPPQALLVLNVADPYHPIVAYTPGEGPTAQVQLIGAPPMTGGYTLIDPFGERRFTNQMSDPAGVVEFFEVAWGTPYGNWTVTHKPGFPAVAPQPQDNGTLDPAYDPANYIDRTLLRFTIEQDGASAPTPEPQAAQGETAPGGSSWALHDLVTGDGPALAPTAGPSASSRTGGNAEGSVSCNNCAQDPNTGYTGPAGYDYCATEGQYCSFSGQRDVAYGGNGRYYYKYDVQNGISCTNSAFGDPYYGYQKACYMQSSAAYIGPSDYSSAPCAYESGYCTVIGTMDVAYGNSGHYYYKYGVTGGTTCSYQSFGGDPFYGVHKACWTKPSASSFTGPSGYSATPCAYEGQYCGVTGTMDVAYGNSGHYYYKYGVTGGTTCSYQNFGGDPIYGVHKACWTKPSASTTATYVGPAGYSATPCAYEGGYCSVYGTRDIAYGNSGSYHYKYGVTGGTTCSYQNFGGDPIYGVHKACFVSNSGSSTTTGCSPPNWELKASHWKWVNRVLVHAPEFGSAKASVASATTQDVYLFTSFNGAGLGGSYGYGTSSTTIAGQQLQAEDGYTVGNYLMMHAAYYHASNAGSGCTNSKMTLTDYSTSGYEDHRLDWSLSGASKSTDADDLSGFWSYSHVAGANVESVRLNHQFRNAEGSLQVGNDGPPNPSCRQISSVNGKIHELGMSIEMATPSGAITAGGTLSYKTTTRDTVSYEYCPGKGHAYEWDNLGGGYGENQYAAAFRTVW